MSRMKTPEIEIAKLKAEVKELRAILADAVSFDDAVTRDDPEGAGGSAGVAEGCARDHSRPPSAGPFVMSRDLGREAQDQQDQLEREAQERHEREYQDRLEREYEDRLERDVQERIEREYQDRLEREAQDRLEQEAQDRLDGIY